MITTLGKRIDALTPRERLLLLLALLVVLYSLWDYALMVPLEDERKALHTAMAEETARLQDLENQLQILASRLGRDPGREQREQLERLEADIAGLDRRLQAATADLIPPALMVQVLEDLLLSRGSLTLLRVQSLEPRAFLSPQETRAGDGQAPQDTAPSPRIYRHGLVLEFQGGYLDVLDYLRAVEALPWRLFWDRLAFRVEDYPRARVSITVHTLSLEEGWIGV